MKSDSKKILVYGGLAILVGSLGYFFYSTIKNSKAGVGIDAPNTTDEKKSTSPSIFANMPKLADSIGWHSSFFNTGTKNSSTAPATNTATDSGVGYTFNPLKYL